jgi:hypothetical protein
VPKPPATSSKLLPRFQLVGFFVSLFIFSVYALGAVFQLPFLRDGFQVDPTVLGILGSVTLVMGGVAFVSRLPGFNFSLKDKPDDDEPDKDA